MTQPAKVQEPSMEEILASIRRIIADDEAKPPVTNDIPPSAIPVPQAAAAKAAVSSAKFVPATSNSQKDIDALLNGLDEASSAEEIRPPLPDSEVFELNDKTMVPPHPSFHRIVPQDPLKFTETAATRALHQRLQFEPSPLQNSTTNQRQILSNSTVSAVESAFNTLSHTVLNNNSRTLEDLVKEMLRPMLKSWLDDSLPGLVEQIVKAEIERVSRGR